jgi:hypothetical protein
MLAWKQSVLLCTTVLGYSQSLAASSCAFKALNGEALVVVDAGW